MKMIGKKNSLVLAIILLFVLNSYVIAMELPTIVGQVKEDNNGYLDVNASTVNFTNAGTWNENFYYGSHIEIENNTAYVLAYPNGLLIFDISDPDAVVKTSVLKLGNAVQNLHVKDGMVYIADADHDLIIVDATNKYAPFLIDSFDLSVTVALDVFVDEDIAFVACGQDGLKVVNVTDPNASVVIDTVGGAMVDVQSITVSDHIAYLAMVGHGFQIMNFTDPNNGIIWVEEYDLTTINYIEVIGDTFYVARSNGIEIFNHSVLGAPTPKGTYFDGGEALEIAAVDGIIYVADERDGIDIINVTNENSPVLITNIETPFDGWATGIKFVDDFIYFVDSPNGLKGYNVTDLNDPIQTLAYGIVGYAFDLAVGNDVAYISNANITLSTVDVQDPNNPTGLGQWDGYTFTSQIEYYEGYIYVLDMTGILIFDVANPVFPELVMNITGTYFANSFYISDDYLYVLIDDELYIQDISLPTLPNWNTTFTDIGFYLRDIVVINETIYLLDGYDVIHVIDATDMNALNYVGSYNSRGNSQGLYHYKDLLFIACSEFLEVTDISQSTIPTYATNFTEFAGYYLNDISIQDGLLYVALGGSIRVLDVRSAYFIKQVGTLATKGDEYFYGLEVIDDTVYIAAGFGGLRIVTIDADLEPVPTETPSGTIVFPGFTILALTTSFVFLGTLVIIKRRRN